MEALNNIVATLGVDLTTAGIWLGAGFVLGLIMVGRRPLGLFGDILLGLVGGAAGGWAFERFGGETSTSASTRGRSRPASRPRTRTTSARSRRRSSARWCC